MVVSYYQQAPQVGRQNGHENHVSSLLCLYQPHECGFNWEFKPRAVVSIWKGVRHCMRFVQTDVQTSRRSLLYPSKRFKALFGLAYPQQVLGQYSESPSTSGTWTDLLTWNLTPGPPSETCRWEDTHKKILRTSHFLRNWPKS